MATTENVGFLRVSDVLQGSVDHGQTPRVTLLLFELEDAAKPETRLAPGGFRRQAAPHEFVGQHCEMGFELVVEIAVE